MNKKPPSDLRLDESYGYAAAKANWLMKTYFQERLRERGLDVTPEQWAVLKAAAENPGLSQTELAARSLKDKTNVTRILDLLEKRKYVSRQARPEDRRSFSVALTAAGRALLEKLIPIARGANAFYLSRLTPPQARRLMESLARICDTIEKGRQP